MPAKPTRSAPRRRRSPQTQRQRIEALPRSGRAAYQRSLTALKRMRSGVSQTIAAAEAGTTPETVQKYVGTAIRKASNGRYQPTKGDRLYRPVQMQTPTGAVTIHTTSFGTASLIARHRAAIGKYLGSGDDSSLKPFARLRIRDGGKEYRFLTSNTLIEELELGGGLDFEGFYHAPR